MHFLLFCSQNAGLVEFRLPEFEAVAELFSLSLAIVHSNADSPFVIVDLPKEEDARLLGSRAVCIKQVWHYWADAPTYDELHSTLKRQPGLWTPYNTEENTWKFRVRAFNGSLSTAEQISRIDQCRYMDFKGRPTMKNADVTICISEEHLPKPKSDDEPSALRIWIGRKVCDGARHLVDKFDLKKRAYIGNTSMESEVSLYMANQALAAPGKFIYDPFAGTGSMLLTNSFFGAMTFGSDIDGRQMRGKGKNVFHSAEQYGIRSSILDCSTFDMTQHPFRCGEMFDAIVTDPPYGVRAGAKRLGRKDTRIKHYVPAPVPGRESEGMAHELPDYVPPSVPWEMTEVIWSLMTFSLYMLRPGGRLVFFLPTESARYSEDDIPKMDGFRLVANSEQPFNGWSRRLITMEKVPSDEAVALEGLDRGIARGEMANAAPSGQGAGHYDFRTRYAAGFKGTKGLPAQ